MSLNAVGALTYSATLAGLQVVQAVQAFEKKRLALMTSSSAFVEKDGKPVGPIRDGDAVVVYNFRGDRGAALQGFSEGDDFSALSASAVQK